MPMVIDHIDYIALKKKRDVLFLSFAIPQEEGDKVRLQFNRDKIMETAIKSWLEREKIDYCLAGPFSWSGFLCGGPMYLYLDVPMDESNSNYQKLCRHLENPDGSPRFRNCRFLYTTLDICKKKAVTYEDV